MKHLSKKELQQFKGEVILFSLLNTKDYLENQVLPSEDLTPEDRSTAEDMLFFIKWVIKEDYPEKSETISKPNWDELKNR